MTLIADISWTGTVQYFGRRHREDKGEQRYPLLAPLFEITAHLDPIFLSLTNLGRISWPPHRAERSRSTGASGSSRAGSRRTPIRGESTTTWDS